MKFLDICSGIGGFRLGFERAGHECVGFIEIDKYARKSYEAMYDTKNEWTAYDVTKVSSEEIPYADCWCFGFPCFPRWTKITTEKGLKNNDILKRVYDPSGISPTLNAMTGGNRQPKIIEDKKIRVKSANSRGYDEAKINDSENLAYPNSTTRRGRVGKQVSQTLQCTSNMGVLSEDYRIRKLTPLECWRLQGFSDELFEKASKVNSSSQLYKQAGNSVTVNVTNVIAEKIGENV